MKAFLMRHGEAEVGLDSDAARNLTPSGRQDVVTMVSRFAQELALVDVIWVSPYTRAQQTALIASELLQQKPMLTQAWLTPSSNPLVVMDALQKTDETVLIVSHQPLVGILLDGLASLEPGSHRMGTAALACIESDVFAKDCGQLGWLHQPEFT